MRRQTTVQSSPAANSPKPHAVTFGLLSNKAASTSATGAPRLDTKAIGTWLATPPWLLSHPVVWKSSCEMAQEKDSQQETSSLPKTFYRPSTHSTPRVMAIEPACPAEKNSPPFISNSRKESPNIERLRLAGNPISSNSSRQIADIFNNPKRAPDSSLSRNLPFIKDIKSKATLPLLFRFSQI